MRNSVSNVNPECPAITELAATIESVFPDIVLFTTNNVSPGTRHTSGLAIDIMLDVTKAPKRRLGHTMIDAFVKNHAAMKWSDLIYSDFSGGKISYFHIPAAGGYGGSAGLLRRNPYTADTRHGDHIHLDYVDWTLKNTGALYNRIPFKWSDAAKTTGFRGALTADLTALGGALSASEPKNPAPIWLFGWWVVTWKGELYYYLFAADGSVRYTRQRPASSKSALAAPQDKADYSVGADDQISLTWRATGSVERFKPIRSGQMSGIWNDREPLAASRL